MKQASTGAHPFSYSGKTEKLVRNVHVVIGLFVMVMQLPFLEFEVWFRTTGFALPVFIFIIGFVYSFIPCRESDEDYLRHIIEPRVAEVDKNVRTRFLQFRKTTRQVVLISGYVYAVIFQLFWILLTNMGDIAIPALFVLFPAFAIVVAVGATPYVMILEKIRYQDLKSLLDTDRRYLKSRQWGKASYVGS